MKWKQFESVFPSIKLSSLWLQQSKQLIRAKTGKSSFKSKNLPILQKFISRYFDHKTDRIIGIIDHIDHKEHSYETFGYLGVSSGKSADNGKVQQCKEDKN